MGIFFSELWKPDRQSFEHVGPGRCFPAAGREYLQGLVPLLKHKLREPRVERQFVCVFSWSTSMLSSYFPEQCHCELDANGKNMKNQGLVT
jgi:hypothetical protein